LSYCYPEPDRIAEGVRRLADVVHAELDMLDLFGPAIEAHQKTAAIAPTSDMA
jgi:hypothetical protein